jgi:hypothetical protein
VKNDKATRHGVDTVRGHNYSVPEEEKGRMTCLASSAMLV